LDLSTWYPSTSLSRLTLNVLRNHGSHFEKAKTAFEAGGGRDELVQELVPIERREKDSIEDVKIEERLEKV
jgi:hypothetical protein